MHAGPQWRCRLCQKFCFGFSKYGSGLPPGSCSAKSKKIDLNTRVSLSDLRADAETVVRRRGRAPARSRLRAGPLCHSPPLLIDKVKALNRALGLLHDPPKNPGKPLLFAPKGFVVKCLPVAAFRRPKAATGFKGCPLSPATRPKSVLSPAPFPWLCEPPGTRCAAAASPASPLALLAR